MLLARVLMVAALGLPAWAGPGETVVPPEATPSVAGGGETYSVTFDEPGTIVFFDRILGTPDGDGMAGTIVVGDGIAPPGEPPPVIRVPQDQPTIQQAVD